MAQKQPKLHQASISIEPLTQGCKDKSFRNSSDIGSLEQWLFHHNKFIESETRDFLREFEQKRGDNDIKALNYCADLMLQMMGNLTNCKATIDASADIIASRVNQTKEIVSSLVPKEKTFQEQRDSIRKSKIEKEEEEKKNCEKQEIANREQIEREFNERVKKIQEKYTQLLGSSAIPNINQL